MPHLELNKQAPLRPWQRSLLLAGRIVGRCVPMMGIRAKKKPSSTSICAEKGGCLLRRRGREGFFAFGWVGNLVGGGEFGKQHHRRPRGIFRGRKKGVSSASSGKRGLFPLYQTNIDFLDRNSRKNGIRTATLSYKEFSFKVPGISRRKSRPPAIFPIVFFIANLTNGRGARQRKKGGEAEQIVLSGKIVAVC